MRIPYVRLQVWGDEYTIARKLVNAMRDPTSADAIREGLLLSGFTKDSDKLDDYNEPKIPLGMDEHLLRLAEKQAELAKLVIEQDVFCNWVRVAGVDAAYEKGIAYAVCVVVDRFGHVVSEGSAEVEVSFPYIPGYFYFREGPALVAAVHGIDFDILLVNAHGVAHPRRLGLASHLGLELGKPTVGVSTGLLVGEIKVGQKGESDIFFGDSRIGVRLDGRPPLIISVGHMVSLETAVNVVKTFWNGVGLPKPLLLAHEAANQLRRNRSRHASVEIRLA